MSPGAGGRQQRADRLPLLGFGSESRIPSSATRAKGLPPSSNRRPLWCLEWSRTRTAYMNWPIAGAPTTRRWRAVPGAVRRDHVPVVHRGHPRPDRRTRGPLLRDCVLR